MSDAGKAIFLSYAHEDAPAARRIAEALRSHGLEVWFDENELRGGDAWDAKIRKQINDCTLFVPLVSKNTEARTKGYFRLEWKLAVEQTHLLAEGVPFVAPVAIDDTRENGAVVPAEFLRVQWTRLPGALPTPQFVEQFKRLLTATSAPGVTAPPMPMRHAPAAVSTPASTAKSPFPVALVATLGVAVLTLAAFIVLRPGTKETPAPAGAHAPAGTKPAADISDKSIAVLPFQNLSEDKDANAFFADGVHEDLLTNLAFVRDLHVVSRTSVMQYRNTTKSIGEIARELKVAYILEGSVRRAGNKVRVTGQLIRAATDEHVWANNYDRDLSDVFAIQAELSKAIAGALQAVLSPATKALLERRPTENPAAYDALLRARALRYDAKFTDPHPEIELLQRAVTLDPNFSAAWADLASRQAYAYFKHETTPEQLAQAKTAIDHATALAPDDPATIEGLGDYYYYGYRDYPRATEQYQRLALVRPNDATVFSSLAFILRRQGRLPECVDNLRRSVQLDPQVLQVGVEFIQTLFSVRRYAESEAAARQFLASHPGNLVVEATLAQTLYAAHGSTNAIREFATRKVPAADQPLQRYLALGNARALGDWAEAIRLDREQRYFDEDDDSPRWTQDVFAAATLAEAGQREAAKARAAEVVALGEKELIRQPQNAQLWATLAFAHGLLGDRDEALRCTDNARELLPETRDKIIGCQNSAMCASGLAYAGEKERALAEFERLLHTSYGTNAVLDGGISAGSWKPLRSDPRFEALLRDPKNNAPLF